MLRNDAAPRVYFDAPVELRADGKVSALTAQGLNLSADGMYVRATEVVTEGSPVELRFPIGQEQVVQTTGRVVRSNAATDFFEPQGMAIQFESLSETSAEELQTFIAQRLEPAVGEKVRMKLSGSEESVIATVQDCWANVVAVEAPLPFLHVGATLTVQRQSGGPVAEGIVQWVSVHVCPETGTPRLNIGIGLTEDAAATELPSLDTLDEPSDPIHTEAFVQHTRALNDQLRLQRRGLS